MEDLTDPQGRFDKSTVRRGLLLVLIVLVAFIALTKIFPSSPTPSPQLTDQAGPGH